VSDAYPTAEDRPLVVSAPGVLGNDTDINGDLLTAAVVAGPAHGTLDLQASGGFTYTPNADYNGADSFTYRASDGALSSVATVSLTMTPVNDAPRFTKGPNLQVHDESGPHIVAGWATAIATGPPDEMGQPPLGQLLAFAVVADNPALFSELPSLNAQGTLTFAPRLNASGTSQVTVSLRDSGGTANSGVDASASQTFAITVTRLRPWYNIVKPLDTTGDDAISAIDAVTVINYLNGPGGGPVPAAPPPPESQIDVDGDGSIAPFDAVLVINHLNAFRFGESAVPLGAAASSALLSAEPTGEGEFSELIALLALDLAEQRPRRRR
jgi:VCBS repeat-containing protein